MINMLIYLMYLVYLMYLMISLMIAYTFDDLFHYKCDNIFHVFDFFDVFDDTFIIIFLKKT